MPLPPALAAKLTKRGIIAPKQKPLDTLKKIDYKGLSTCPNKNNIYHECTHWCETHWKGILTPESKYMRNMQKVLVKYPLPNNWTEVFDKGIGRYYYWNMETDMVSWLPPKHPKAVLTKSASKLRERRVLDNKEDKTKDDSRREKDGDRNSDKERDKDSDDDDRSYRSKHSDRSARERGDRERDRDKDRDDRRKRDRDDRYRREKEKRQKKDDQLDPMDPAAYSDIPQGTWSDGLETNKIRADNTASGVLFQQRPYPAPGAVLAANKEKERRK